MPVEDESISNRCPEGISGHGSFVNRVQVHGSVLFAGGDVAHLGVNEFRVRKLDVIMLAALAHPHTKRL